MLKNLGEAKTNINLSKKRKTRKTESIARTCYKYVIVFSLFDSFTDPAPFKGPVGQIN